MNSWIYNITLLILGASLLMFASIITYFAHIKKNIGQKTFLLGFSYSATLQTCFTVYTLVNHQLPTEYMPIEFIFTQCLGLLIYYYIYQSHLQPYETDIKKSIIKVIMPFLAAMLLYVAIAKIFSIEIYRYRSHDEFYGNITRYDVWGRMLICYSMIALYIIKTIKIIRFGKQFQDEISGFFSDPWAVDMHWLFNLFLLNISCIVVYVSVAPFNIELAYMLNALGILINWIYGSIYVYKRRDTAINIAALSLDIANNKQSSKQTPTDNHADGDNITNEYYQSLGTRLNKVMTEDKLWQNESLTLIELSKACITNRTTMSAYLNNYLGTNFYKYINGIRIEYIIDMVSKDGFDNIVLDDIYKQAGFGSYQSFYRAFIAMKGVSPKQFFKNTND